MERFEVGSGLAGYPLDELPVTDDERERLLAMIESHAIEPLDLIISLRIFQIILICRASSTETICTARPKRLRDRCSGRSRGRFGERREKPSPGGGDPRYQV